MKDEERTPLRTVLINFLNHIENLESDKFPEKSYDSEFQDLKLFSESVKGLKQYSCLEGEKEVNRKKNRYKDILPFDLSRVILNEYAGIPGSDYINANYIKGASGSIAYIASQGPLPNTINDFWRMVVQCEVQVIVMACNEEEAGKTKCEKYWVEDKEEKQFGMVSVKLLKASTVCPDFSVRTMRLKYTNSQSVVEERTVCQLHFVAWPDHGVPSVVQPLLDMVRLVRDTQASETLPVLVHCSAGCGRTGTICAIDYVWGLLRTGKLTKDFSLLGLVREMRRQRIAMVQTKEQYVLVHQAVRELFKEQLSMIDSHPYENVDTNGVIRMKVEPVYDTVDNIISCNNEEKRDDKNEKEMIAPPLPLKRRPGVLASKQEKEVENLTARQKLLELADSSSDSVTSSNTGSSRVSKIDKLKHQFEVGYDGMPNNLFKKLSLLSNKKGETVQPIPSRGVLRVPQLEGKTLKSVSSVKRSKSLKLLSSEERQKLMICNELSEGRHRTSLESNLEEPQTESCVILENNKFKVEKVEEGRHVCQIVKDYEALCLFDRRPLGRSYTTLDMRQKSTVDSISKEDTSVNRSIGGVPVKNRRKISRSHTQLELGKTLQRKTCSDTQKSFVIISNKTNSSPKCKYYDINGDYCEKVAFNYDNLPSGSPDWVAIESTTRGEESVCPDKSNFELAEVSPRVHMTPKKTDEQHYKTFEMMSISSSSREGSCVKSMPISNQSRTKSINLEQLQSTESVSHISELQNHYVCVNGNIKNSVQPLNKERFVKTNSKNHCAPVRCREKLIKEPKILDSKSSWDQQKKMIRNEEKGYNRSRQEPIYTNMSFKGSKFNDTPKPMRLNKNLHKPIEPDRSTKPLSPGNVSYPLGLNGRYAKQTQLAMPREHQNVISFNKQPGIHNPKNFQGSSKTKSKSGNKLLQPMHSGKNVHSSSVCSNSFHRTPTNNSSDRPDKIQKSATKEEKGLLKGPLSVLPVDSTVGITGLEEKCVRTEDYSPLSQTESHFPTSYGLKTRYVSQDDNVMTSNVTASTSKVKRHTSVVLQRTSKTDPSHWAVWTGNGDAKINTVSVHNWEGDQPWQSAPGVDIDQVAASISQKDGSRNKLIKAALEALHLRKSKQSSESSDHLAVAGGSHIEQSKKQQYL